MDALDAPINVLLTLTGPLLGQVFTCLLGDDACSLEVADQGVLLQAGNLSLASTCGEHALGLSVQLVPATERANAGVTEYVVQDIRSLSASGLVELALCWMGGEAPRTLRQSEISSCTAPTNQ